MPPGGASKHHRVRSGHELSLQRPASGGNRAILEHGFTYNWVRLPVERPIPPTLIALLVLLVPAAAMGDTFDGLLRQGLALHKQRLYAQAIAPLERAHRLQPFDYYANLLLGIDYLRTGQPGKALSFLETASRVRPTDATALGYSAEAYAAEGRIDLALGALQAARRRDPSPQWRAALIRLYLTRFRTIAHALRLSKVGLARSYRLQAQASRNGNFRRERESLLRAYALAPELEGIETELAHAEIRQQRFDAARHWLQRARARNPRDLGMITAQVYLSAHESDWQEAEARLQELKQQSRRSTRTALAEWPDGVPLPDRLRDAVERMSELEPTVSSDIRTMFRSQQWEAVAAAVSPSEEDPDRLFQLGVARARLQQFEKAVDSLERVRSGTRHRGEADYWLALSYARLAEDEAETLVRDHSADPILHAVRGEILLRLAADGAAAAAEYRRAVDSAPGDPALWAGLAAAEAMAGNWDDAREAAQKALGLDPSRVLALRTYAELSIQERDYPAAIPALEKILEFEAGDAGAKFLLGTAYSQTGEHEKALVFLRAAERQGYPDEKGRLQYLLGTVLRRLDRPEEAGVAFRNAQELSDTFAATSHSLAQPGAGSDQE